ncbi:O-antigen ligase family protein, partial [Salmonella enterica subsp. enterica serovar Typhimurium]|uniref:O-antigen ligase family protein n=1 Tax=Salmonella enterica TaxID=28901 RepID=UPI0020A57799
RINDFAKELVKQDTSANGKNLGSTGIRIAIWRDAVPQIKQHLPFGVGVGDVQTILQENYQKRGMTTAFEKRFNMHNEYLQQLAGS